MTLDTARMKAAINDGDQFDSDLVLRLLDEIDALHDKNRRLWLTLIRHELTSETEQYRVDL
jgi:gluconate kinase